MQMNRSSYITHTGDLILGGEHLLVASASPAGLGEWEQDDPCRYAGQSCKGKVFGALKKCRRRREKSQALCDAQKKQLEQKAQWEAQREDMLQVLQTNVTTTARQQQTASSAMKTGVAVGGVALVGAAALFMLKHRSKSKKSK